MNRKITFFFLDIHIYTYTYITHIELFFNSTMQKKLGDRYFILLTLTIKCIQFFLVRTFAAVVNLIYLFLDYLNKTNCMCEIQF